jgi:sphingolipid delta-4 desaturase
MDPALLSDFRRLTTPDPHRQRRREILRAHPDVRSLYGANPWSGALIAALVASHFALAWALRGAPVWLLFAAAFGVGAYLSAALNALIHDASHLLVFRGRALNHLAAMAANLPLVLWSAEPFFRYHADHHRAFGDYHQDVGVPTEAEARWVGNRAWRKALWLAAFPVFQGLRTLKYHNDRPYWGAWMALNIGIQVATGAAVLALQGPGALAYLLLSASFALGLHPLGTRVVQEHFTTEAEQETHNYSGWPVLLECNFGYHVEHHDFPAVPWNRLPRLRRIAPEFYAGLDHYPSRLRLLIDFISKPAWDLHRNFVRETQMSARDAAAAAVA